MNKSSYIYKIVPPIKLQF